MSAFIKNGEFFTLLGPSGCGKTTLLRMIAGFNSIEGGTIKFDDKVINDIPAQKRNIGMVFQSYAIFPHLTVRQNVEYGLKIRKVPKEHMKERVDEILKVVKIDEYQDRLPERLSGGQQQRVALARPLSSIPRCFSWMSRCPIWTPSCVLRCAAPSVMCRSRWVLPRFT